ncbi:Protein ABTS-2 [Aphelenchoides avenae]|nr:Protein ABTS-2 [Aphelenchus avenae]
MRYLEETFTYDENASVITMTRFWEMPLAAHGVSAALGFPLAILFFMDQLIVTKTVDNTQNNLQKGSAHHWDLLVIAVLNLILSVVGLPWMHGALPQAYLHLKAYADVEDRVVGGVVQQV